jgi:hypothetical protein
VSTTGAQAWIAGFYDVYVTTTIDVPFFQEELKKTPSPVLELMAGTGRLSLPLAEAGARLTCVDVSGPMLARLRTKLVDQGLEADLVEADICRMTLPERSYGLALLPFQSASWSRSRPSERRSTVWRPTCGPEAASSARCTIPPFVAQRSTANSGCWARSRCRNRKARSCCGRCSSFCRAHRWCGPRSSTSGTIRRGGWRTSIGSTCASALWNGASFRPLPRPRASGWPRSTVPMIDHPSTTGQALS